MIAATNNEKLIAKVLNASGLYKCKFEVRERKRCHLISDIWAVSENSTEYPIEPTVWWEDALEELCAIARSNKAKLPEEMKEDKPQPFGGTLENYPDNQRR